MYRTKIEQFLRENNIPFERETLRFVHREGLPVDCVSVGPHPDQVSGRLNELFVTPETILRATLREPYLYNSWTITESHPYTSKPGLLQLLKTFKPRITCWDV